ncbi:MAG: hypothetical protein AAF223_10425 [Bacteroidota bacterium]
MTRLIPIESIPNSLWSKQESTLRLPLQVTEIWSQILENNELTNQAKQKAPDRIIGGMSKKDTDDFLAWRFPGSSAKVILTVLDPNDDLPQIPDTFARIFSGNKVFMADLPCGSGTASLNILSVFYELRKINAIPRMPLNVVVLGGEISEHARGYADESLKALQEKLEEQAIFLEFSTHHWDVCNQLSNSDLVKEINIRSHECSSKLIYMSHFSGFLEKEKKWRDAQAQFGEVFRHFRSDNSIVLWLEPDMKAVTRDNGFFPRLIKWFSQAFSQYFNREAKNKKYVGFAEKMKTGFNANLGSYPMVACDNCCS